MTCAACVLHVQSALLKVPGVLAARVDLPSASATVEWEPETQVPSWDELRAAVNAAGYDLGARSVRSFGPILRASRAGLLGSMGLLLFYLGVIRLAQGWDHALRQLAADAWFIAVIAAGFGIQVGLFSYMRSRHFRTGAGGVAAGGGTGTAAMLACCAHHLADILPVIGFSGAAVFLNTYRESFLWLGVTMNLAGAIYLAAKLKKCCTVTTAVQLQVMEPDRGIPIRES